MLLCRRLRKKSKSSGEGPLGSNLRAEAHRGAPAPRASRPPRRARAALRPPRVSRVALIVATVVCFFLTCVLFFSPPIAISRELQAQVATKFNSYQDLQTFSLHSSSAASAGPLLCGVDVFSCLLGFSCFRRLLVCFVVACQALEDALPSACRRPLAWAARRLAWRRNRRLGT